MKHLFTYGPRLLCLKAVAILWTFCAAPVHADVHILALGDSLTQGYGLIEDEGFVPQLRGWLAERGHEVRVVNGGVSGDTTAGGLSRVDWSLTPEINGLIVALGGNDLLRGIDPQAVRANLQGILDVAQSKNVEVLLIGMEAPGNYGPDYKETFDAIYPELAKAYDAIYLESFFAGLGVDTLQDASDVMQADGIHPNGEGVKMIVTGVGPMVEELIMRIEGQP